MPLYEFVILDSEGNKTEEVIEMLYKASEVPAMIRSSCGRWAARKPISIIARPASSLDSYGLNGTYNRGLGEVIYSHKHYDEVCKRKGLIPESCFDNKHIFNDLIQRQLEHDKKEDAQYHKWEATMAKEGVLGAVEGTRDWTERWERVWDEMLPAHEILDNTISISTGVL